MASDGSISHYCDMVSDNICAMESLWENPNKKQRDYLDCLRDNVILSPIKLKGDFYLVKHKKEIKVAESPKRTKKRPASKRKKK